MIHQDYDKRTFRTFIGDYPANCMMFLCTEAHMQIICEICQCKIVGVTDVIG